MAPTSTQALYYLEGFGPHEDPVLVGQRSGHVLDRHHTELVPALGLLHSGDSSFIMIIFSVRTFSGDSVPLELTL